ncbi:hypothetical protein JEQ12_008866 [Ovis aries]|uniref:Core domain-containing protein n=2 Tax=Ovis aries TaxID=9940 RepID=A0A836D6B1_SHEEP|nr:hypothetical protein JEQ12_008866 [Ovis aries]
MSASLVRATVRAVSKRKLQPTRAALTLTPSAVNKIKQLLKDKPEHVGVKVGVRTRGCNGLSYTLEYTKTKGDSDEEVIQDGVRVFIEKKAQLTLLGTEMDFVEDKLSRIRDSSQGTVSFNRDMDPSKDGEEDESLTCSLPELYAFVENFNKENKKLNLLKMHCISPGEAQRMLSQKHFLNGTGGTEERADDSLPVFTCKVVRKEERPESMSELLHRSLLTRSLSPVERLSKSQQRISEYGIPPPVHTFPHEILIDHSKSESMVTIQKKIQSSKILCRLGIPCVSPEKFIFEDKAPKYFLIDPAKQFMDLRDLEWRFYKGLVKWKRCILNEFSDIKNDSEKRFVGSQQLPHPLSPPLVHKSLVIYPQVDYPKTLSPS